MSLYSAARERVRALLRGRRGEEELEEELRFHLEMATEANRRAGMDEAEARRRAVLAFGGVERVKEEVRDARGLGLLADLVRDVRYGARSLGRHHAYTAVVVATLALGIGATTAVFAVVSGLVLKPLPFAEPDRLVQLYGTSALSPERGAVSRFPAYRAGSTVFRELVGYWVSARYLRRPGGAARVRVVVAEPDFFRMLGVAPRLGRTFGRGDPPDVAVVSEAFWRQRLGGDPAAIGRTLDLDGRPYTVVGVMPAGFQFPYGAASLLPGVAAEVRTDLWVPVERPFGAGSQVSSVTGRLKPGVTLEAARGELALLTARLRAEDPEPEMRRGVYLEPLREAVVTPAIRRLLYLLFGAVAIVLALACANAVNLSLVRASLRRREYAIRLSLGAGRGRLLRQLVTEGLLLGLAAGGVGLAVAWAGTRQLLRLAATRLPRVHEVTLDWRVAVFLLAACVVAGVAVGLVPALVGGGSGPQAALRGAADARVAGRGERRLRDGLVVAELALAFVLAVGAAVLLRELARLRATDPGMTTRGVVAFHLGERAASDDVVRRYTEIADRVEALPGVEAAGLTQLLPLQNWGWTANSSTFTPLGRAPGEGAPFPIELRSVTAGYFRTLGIPVVRGRGFSARPDPDGAREILINQALARRAFPGVDPVGTETSRGTIVGVVGDVRQVSLDRPAAPEIYTPVAINPMQVSELGMSLVVRARGDAAEVVPEVRAAVRGFDPDLAIFGVQTMDRVVADSLADFVLSLSVVAVLAGLALVLAVVGAYGVVSYVTESRSSEFAIRTALGADRGRVTRAVLAQGLRLAAMGVALGLAAVGVLAPALERLPVSVRPPDPGTTAPIALGLALVVALACLLPARRAAGLDPAAVLRRE